MSFVWVLDLLHTNRLSPMRYVNLIKLHYLVFCYISKYKLGSNSTFSIFSIVYHNYYWYPRHTMDNLYKIWEFEGWTFRRTWRMIIFLCWFPKKRKQKEKRKCYVYSENIKKYKLELVSKAGIVKQFIRGAVPLSNTESVSNFKLLALTRHRFK